MLMKTFYLLLCLTIAACTISPRIERAETIAQKAMLTLSLIESSPFKLTVFERINAPGQTATLYIEGDGLAWTSRSSPSLDPTPTNPVALNLASLDNTPNVIYMARPCQFSKMANINETCPQKYWTSHRFAHEVIKAMNDAIDQIQNRYSFTGINLVGYSGGGAIATLLAAQRDDILSLRTVAGNLDHVTLHNIHHVAQTPQSLNPKDVAQRIAEIPQLHFLGSNDTQITSDIYESFYQASGQSHCIQSITVRNTTHQKGWSKIWPTLLQKPLNCKGI